MAARFCAKAGTTSVPVTDTGKEWTRDAGAHLRAIFHHKAKGKARVWASRPFTGRQTERRYIASIARPARKHVRGLPAASWGTLQPGRSTRMQRKRARLVTILLVEEDTAVRTATRRALSGYTVSKPPEQARRKTRKAIARQFTSYCAAWLCRMNGRHREGNRAIIRECEWSTRRDTRRLPTSRSAQKRWCFRNRSREMRC